MSNNVVKSLSENVWEWIGNFLLNEGFKKCAHTQNGILYLVDSIQSYSEEGQILYPEILITTNIEKVLETLPTYRKIFVGREKLSADAFTLALKKCATLAKNGWIIFINRLKNQIEYGIINAKSSELSPSIYRHIVGDLALKNMTIPIVYLRKYGPNAIEIRGSHNSLVISLSLSSKYHTSVENLQKFSSKAINGLVDSLAKDLRDQVSSFLHSLLDNTIKECYGCLIAVVKGEKNTITKFKRKYPDGLYLPEPIDLVTLVEDLSKSATIQVSLSLNAYASVVREMIAYDGITILSNKGQILGYNLFIERTDTKDKSRSGGARYRAFLTLKNSALIECALFYSHDGKLELWEKRNVS